MKKRIRKFIRKLRKVRWDNILKLILAIFFIILILKDLKTVLFSFAGFTWFGLATHCLYWYIAYTLLNSIFHFDEEE